MCVRYNKTKLKLLNIVIFLSFLNSGIILSERTRTQIHSCILPKSSPPWQITNPIAFNLKINCVISNVFNFSVLDTSHLQHGNDNDIHLTEILRGFNELINIKHLKQYLGHNNYSVSIGCPHLVLTEQRWHKYEKKANYIW